MGDVGSKPTVSVVINTYNRAESLESTLRGLTHLDYPAVEVVVVDGPSTDGTSAVLARFHGRIKLGRCPERNLSKSRNVGIALAAGEIVAFIDDDAYPDPGWLDAVVDGLLADDDSAAAGGPVFDHTGAAFQARYSLANRLGEAWTSAGPNPTDWLSSPYTPVYPYPIGTNVGFRRDRLVEVGGFDEEFEYYLDETDVVLRLIDRGYLVKALDEGFVYHKFLPSAARNDRRALTNRFAVLKNRWYFALRHGRPWFSDREIEADLARFVEHHREDLANHLRLGSLSPADSARFEEDAAAAESVARAAIVRGPCTRPAAWFAGQHEPFLPFPTVRPDGRRLHVCIVSQEYVPHQLNGIARVLHSVATELGAMGHVVRVITESEGHATVDLEGDVWVHRVVPDDSAGPSEHCIPAGVWRFPSAVLAEIRRIDGMCPVDIVQVPNWASEGAAVLATGGFRTVMGLYSPLLTVAALDHRIDLAHPHNAALLELELEGYQQASAVLACGPSIVREIEDRYDVSFERDRVGLVPHGLPDVAPESTFHVDAPVILFVGRLEPRKGIDTLLEAAPDVLRHFPTVRLVLAGNDTILGPDGRTYAEAFQRDPTNSDLRDRVSFLGIVGDDELAELYASSDICVAPSRYESFGLIAIEAMRAGKPVIVADVGGLSEIVDDGQSGLLIRPGDAGALREALVDLLTSDRLEMGKRGRAAYESRFTSRRMAEDIVAFYRQVLELPPEPGERIALPDDVVVGAGLLDLVCCPICRGTLRAQPEVLCVDGRIKEGTLVCERCLCLAARIQDFRTDFHVAGQPPPLHLPAVQVRPILGEWRVPPSAPPLDLQGSWTPGPNHLAGPGNLGDRLRFIGRCTDLVVRFARTPWSGRVGVFVDGDPSSTIDLYEPEGTWVAGVQVLTNAPDHLHTVDLVALGEHSPGAHGNQVHVEELVVKGPLGPGRPFALPAPINRGNPYSAHMERFLELVAPGTPVLEIGGGDRRRAVPGHINFEYLPFELADMYGDIHRLPFADGTFDMVCSQAVFEHVNRPFEAAQELLRVTRPGGVIFTEVAFLQPVHAVPHHYFNMTVAGARELFPGCAVLEEGWFGPLSETVDWMLRAAGLSTKVSPAKLDRIVSLVRALDPLVDHEALEAVASGVYLAVRTPPR
jgi:glycogen synthase